MRIDRCSLPIRIALTRPRDRAQSAETKLPHLSFPADSGEPLRAPRHRSAHGWQWASGPPVAPRPESAPSSHMHAVPHAQLCVPRAARRSAGGPGPESAPSSHMHAQFPTRSFACRALRDHDCAPPTLPPRARAARGAPLVARARYLAPQQHVGLPLGLQPLQLPTQTIPPTPTMPPTHTMPPTQPTLVGLARSESGAGLPTPGGAHVTPRVFPVGASVFPATTFVRVPHPFAELPVNLDLALVNSCSPVECAALGDDAPSAAAAFSAVAVAPPLPTLAPPVPTRPAAARGGARTPTLRRVSPIREEECVACPNVLTTDEDGRRPIPPGIVVPGLPQLYVCSGSCRGCLHGDRKGVGKGRAAVELIETWMSSKLKTDIRVNDVVEVRALLSAARFSAARASPRRGERDRRWRASACSRRLGPAAARRRRRA